MEIVTHNFSPMKALGLVGPDIPLVLARAFAIRGVSTRAEANPPLSELLPYQALKGAVEMANILADAIEKQQRLLIVADYDADGATACSVGIRALKAFGANVGYLIPNRVEHGYGLTKEIAEVACGLTPKPEYIITVDNGIASFDGVATANALGVPVLVTDHHLPAEEQPAAAVIVNPNQHGCTFPSKALAGCGVIFYVMLALQDELHRRKTPGIDEGFKVESLLPLVAVGTVADVVPLDLNNRILVGEGVRQIREGHSFPGIEMLAKVAKRNPRALSTSDIGFALGPRINAAGRLASMDAGVECLTTDNIARAEVLANDLDAINALRKDIEGDITDTAIQRLSTEIPADRNSVVLYGPDWHQGVIGIVAGRIKERVWRPTFVLGPGNNGEYKGSGRSIPGFHLRDALALIDIRKPGLLIKFGGHAMAAGVTVAEERLPEFAEAFEQAAKELIPPAALNHVIEVDGGLDAADLSIDTAYLLKKQIWGQGFLEPYFADTFKVVSSRPIGDGKHLSMKLEKDGKTFSAVKFRHEDGAPPPRVTAVYRLDANKFRDETNLQLLVEFMKAA